MKIGQSILIPMIGGFLSSMSQLTRKEDFDYFGKIRQQLENGGYEALMHDLLHEDLTGFDPKVMPENYRRIRHEARKRHRASIDSSMLH